MIVTVDATRCIGCRLCVAACPAIFSMDGRVANAMRGEIPPDFAHRTVYAADGCPVQAILIEGEA